MGFPVLCERTGVGPSSRNHRKVATEEAVRADLRPGESAVTRVSYHMLTSASLEADT